MFCNARLNLLFSEPGEVLNIPASCDLSSHNVSLEEECDLLQQVEYHAGNLGEHTTYLLRRCLCQWWVVHAHRDFTDNPMVHCVSAFKLQVSLRGL